MDPNQLKRLFPNASRSTIKLNQASHQPSCPVMERPASDESLAAPQGKTSDSGRYLVRVVSYRTRLLDEDNLAEKYHVDACRYAGLIPADSPDRTTIQVTQEKVATKEQERTEVTIQQLFPHEKNSH